MTYRGIVQGRTIVLEHPLPYPDGTAVTVSIHRADTAKRETGAAILSAEQAPPILASEDVAELERVIESSRFPVRIQDLPSA